MKKLEVIEAFDDEIGMIKVLKVDGEVFDWGLEKLYFVCFRLFLTANFSKITFRSVA